jgi:glycosyltransferase involved in cell wall biosynthesis
MRIVYVLTSLGMGGAERQVLGIADRMAARGHTVALLVLRPRLPEEWPTSLNVLRLKMRREPFSVLAGMASGRRFLKEFQPDIVQSHSFHANIVARFLKFFFPSIPVLSTIHNFNEGGWLRMMAYRLTDRLSRRTTAVSQAAADRFVKMKAVPRRKCIVLTNGIDTAEFAPSADRRAGVRAQMEARTNFIWLAVGRIVPAKDYPNLLQAFTQVHAINSDAQLWIAGESSVAAPRRAAHFVAEVKKGSPAGVRWLGLRRDLPSLLDAADAFVMSSAWEGMPLAIGEAMAMEKPVVATDVGGVRELMWACGSLVPPKDPGALATAMLEMMHRLEEDRITQGRAARARIQHYFNIDAKADEWEALYKATCRLDTDRN